MQCAMKEGIFFARSGSVLSRSGIADSEGSSRGRANNNVNESNKSQYKSFFTIIHMKIARKRENLQKEEMFKT